MGFDYYPFKNGILSSYTKQPNNVFIAIHLNVSFIWLKFMVNAGTYSIHGASGYVKLRIYIYIYGSWLTLSEDDWGLQSPPQRIVFRFDYHSQKVIGPLGYVYAYYICIQKPYKH